MEHPGCSCRMSCLRQVGRSAQMKDVESPRRLLWDLRFRVRRGQELLWLELSMELDLPKRSLSELPEWFPGPFGVRSTKKGNAIELCP